MRLGQARQHFYSDLSGSSDSLGFMNRIVNGLGLALFAFSLVGCATGSYNSHTGPGFIYTDHYEGDLVTANVAGRRRGEACTQNILGLFTSGDGSLSAAMKNGGVTSVSSADYHYKSVLGVWGKVCLIVTGN